MLNLKDLNEIRQLIKEGTKYLPTKEDFYNKMDELLGEVKAMREEQTLISGRLSESSDQLENHENRIGKIEKILQSPP